MIALDTSAIIAILRQEDEAEVFAELIARNGAIIGTPTLLELHLVLSRKLEGGAGNVLERIVNFHWRQHIRVVAFYAQLAELGMEAFDRYGKGSASPAGLNYGDCMSYAVAKFHQVPLLFKGNDFIHTDLVPAYIP